MPAILLNGNTYHLRGEVQTYPVEQYAQAIMSGLPSRANETKLRKLIYNQWHKWGLGYLRADAVTGSGVGGGVRDATVDTRFATLFLPILHEAQTHASNADHFVKYLEFKGDLWAAFEEDNDGAQNDAVARKYGATSDNWTGGGTIVAGPTGSTVANNSRVFDMIIHQENLYAATSRIAGSGVQVQQHGIFSSSDGASWSVATGTGWVNLSMPNVIVARNTFSDDMAKMLSYGVTLLHAAADDNGNEAIEEAVIYYTVNSGTNWTLGATIPTSYGIKAFLRWKDPYSSPVEDSPVLVLAEGIYRVDAGGTTSDLIYGMDGNENNGRNAKIGNDDGLIFGTGNGDLNVLYINSTGAKEIRRSGPPADGLVNERRGHVNDIYCPTGDKYYYVAYGGHAGSQQASIFAVTYAWHTNISSGDLEQTWHSLYQEGDANLDIIGLIISTEDDGTPRLHFSIEGAGTSEMYHLENPFDNEAQSQVAHKRASAGFIEFSEENGGDPHIPKNILRARVDVEDLSADDTGEYIEHEYGIDGADWANVSNFGHFISGDKELLFGRTQQNVSGQSEAGASTGITAHTIRNKLILNNNTAANTPMVHEYELTVETHLPRKQGFQLTIDIGLTVQEGDVTEDDVRTNIDAVLDSVPLVSFTYPTDESTALLVRASRYTGALESGPPGTNIDTERVGGTITLNLEERL
jgi:hypothetical protein